MFISANYIHTVEHLYQNFMSMDSVPLRWAIICLREFPIFVSKYFSYVPQLLPLVFIYNT